MQTEIGGILQFTIVHWTGGRSIIAHRNIKCFGDNKISDKYFIPRPQYVTGETGRILEKG